MAYDTRERRAGRRRVADANAATSRARSAAHAEWLLDEAVRESFPASDPPATSYPGSSLARLEAAREVGRARSVRRIGAAGALLLAALAFVVMHRRGSRAGNTPAAALTRDGTTPASARDRETVGSNRSRARRAGDRTRMRAGQ